MLDDVRKSLDPAKILTRSVRIGRICPFVSCSACAVSHLAHVVGDGGGGHVADGELRVLVVNVGGDAAVDVAPQHHHLHHQLALVSTS